VINGIFKVLNKKSRIYGTFGGPLENSSEHWCSIWPRLRINAVGCGKVAGSLKAVATSGIASRLSQNVFQIYSVVQFSC